MYLVFFYKPSYACQTLPVSSIFSQVKTGLEETLSDWYPAAGRNPNDGKLDLWCNNSGAILVEAVTQVKISELGDLSHYSEFFEILVFKPVGNGNISLMPLVVAQVTKFGCGGHSLGIGTSHSLFDGPAAYNFLCAWASQSNMKGIKEGFDHQLHKPVHETDRLLMTNYQTPKGSNNLCEKLNPEMIIGVAAIDQLYELVKQVGIDQNQENYVLRTFHLSGAMIDKLKRKILGEKRGSYSCSSFEMVNAHL